MALDEGLLKRIADVLANGRPATREDLLANYPQEITLARDYVAYANPRVTAAIDAASSAEVTHLKFHPMPLDGLVLIVPATTKEEGAVEFNRSDSRRTGTFNMRVGLNDFALEFSADRHLKLPVRLETLTVEQQKRSVLVVTVKNPRTKKTGVRKQKPAQPEPGATAPAGGEMGA